MAADTGEMSREQVRGTIPQRSDRNALASQSRVLARDGGGSAYLELMPISSPPPRLIELKLRDVHQLFNSMDPSPFNDKDLDSDAEEFIVNWSREYAPNEPLTLRIDLENWPAEDPTALIQNAVHHYFDDRAKFSDLEFRRMMRQGRLSLLIGLVFLGACLLAGHMLDGHPGPLFGYAHEGLTIAGWVGMWRPMEIFLYDWWPVRRQHRNFVRLSTMPIEVVAKAAM